MRIVFCGTATFAVPSLSAVAAEHEVVTVVTQPDRPGSRGRPARRPVGDAATEMGLPIVRPERIRDAETVRDLLALAPDALVVAAYGQIIPAALLDGPPLGGVNVHGSLLPRWRGAAPIAAAILHGDRRTGISIMRMDTGLDTGPVYAQREVEIAPTDTATSLTERLAQTGADLLSEVLEALAGPGIAVHPQDGSLVTVARRLRREDGRLDWDDVDAAGMDRAVRGLEPWPGVTVPLAGQRVRVLQGRPLPGDASPSITAGTIVATNGEHVDMATRSGVYRLVEVQPPGGRPMSAAAYLRGRPSAAGTSGDQRPPDDRATADERRR